MTIRSFGFARPISIDHVKPGMILCSTIDEGERVVGVCFKTEYETYLAVIWSNRDGDIPRAEELNARFAYGVIDGTLEVEPEEVQDAFQTPSKLGSETSITISSDGTIGAAMAVSPFGTPTRVYIDLETGETAGPSSRIAPVPFYRLWISQEGRRDRWPLVDLIP